MINISIQQRAPGIRGKSKQRRTRGQYFLRFRDCLFVFIGGRRVFEPDNIHTR